MSWEKKTIVIFEVTRLHNLERIVCSWINQKGGFYPFLI